MLHLVDPKDEIFARDYVYVRPAKAKAVATMPLLDNADGFYNNLPMINPKSKHSKQ